MDQKSSNVNEQVIKDILNSLESEKVTINFHQTTLANQKKLPSPDQYSDWANKCRLRYSEHKTSQSKSPKNTQVAKQMSITSIIPRQNHILRIGSNKTPLLLSPINVKFCHKPNTNLRNSFRKKRQSHYCSMSVSVNQTNKKSLFQLYRLKNSSKKSRMDIIEDPQVGYQSHRVRKHPKTEMISSIVRVMKKRQQILSCRKSMLQKREWSGQARKY